MLARRFGLVLIFIQLSLGAAAAQPLSLMQTDDRVEFDHLVFATANLDSLVDTYAKAHFEVRYAKPISPLDDSTTLVDTVLLNKATYIELRQDPMLAALAPSHHDTLQSPCVAIVFRAHDLAALRHRIVSIAKVAVDSVVTTQDRFHPEGVAAFRLAGASPTSIYFIGSDATPLSDSVHRAFDLNWLDWLVLTGSLDEQIATAHALDVLPGVHKQREGCCDYWVIGSPAHLIRLRFDPDDIPQGKGHLSIERFGLVFAH